MKLRIEDLRFSYHDHHVLHHVSFEANEGECIAILGKNGAGKTTLFRCILGLLRGYDGSILIDEKPARKFSQLELAKVISYIPQAHAPTFNYSVFQTVLMGTNATVSRFKTPGEKEQALALEKLELLGISHLASRGYAEISGGERQLVLIARALVQQAKILVMDEPTANLDYGNQVRIMKQVQTLTSQGYLVLLTTHNPEHALLYADKALVLNKGVVIEYGPPNTVLTPELIETIYGVKVEMRRLVTAKGKTSILLPSL